MDLVGKTLDRFRIDELIGRGRLSVCYRATNTVLGNTVALKVLAPEFRSQPLLVSIFHEKAEIVAQLNHPNIVHVHDLVAYENDLFAVMEYVRGDKLSDILSVSRHVEPREGLRILSGMCDAIAGVHEAGSAHFKLKPHNIFVRPNGTPVVMEFGMFIPSIYEVIPQLKEDKADVQFLAPEEILGHPSGQCTDFWNLGLTAYYLFTGRFPFEGDTAGILKESIVAESSPARPTSFRPDLPDGLDAIILKLLARKSEYRYSSAKEVLGEIQMLLHSIEHQSDETRTAVSEDIFDPHSELPALGERQARHVGPYRLLDRKGTGSFAIVYMAEDRRTGRIVALKLLKPEFAESEEVIERFQQEAEFDRRIQHPNVVECYEYGVEENASGRRDLYFTMEYIEGPRLKDLIEKGDPLPPERVLEIGLQIANGLQAAHDLGIIHRDLKPANILIDKSGRALIADFGIAVAHFVTNRLTATGQLVGTYAYMSPEQALAEEVNPASDLYSLGVILFEMLTGDLPMEEGPPIAMLKHIVEDPPFVFPDSIEASPALKELIVQLLRKAPEERLQSAAEVAEKLEAMDVMCVGRET